SIALRSSEPRTDPLSGGAPAVLPLTTLSVEPGRFEPDHLDGEVCTGPARAYRGLGPHTRTEHTVAIPARTRLARLLAGESETTSQSAMLRLPAEVLDLHVDGVGAVPLPVRAPLARRLVAASAPAHFGRGEETLLDAAVRDTGEIAPDRVTLAGERWQARLAEALEV